MSQEYESVIYTTIYVILVMYYIPVPGLGLDKFAAAAARTSTVARTCDVRGTVHDRQGPRLRGSAVSGRHALYACPASGACWVLVLDPDARLA